MTNNTDPNIALMPLLATVKDAVGAELHARLMQLGFPEIRPAHGCVFGNIDRDGSRLTELAERSGFTKQSVGEAVADLERLGFVERVPDPADGRAKIIRLTPHGAEALAAAAEIFADIESRFAQSVGPERYAAFRATLAELHALSRLHAAEPFQRAAA